MKMNFCRGEQLLSSSLDHFRSQAPCSCLADAVKVISLSNARRAELEKDADELTSQLREARAKDFNAGRLFRLEVANAELEKQVNLYKAALEEARGMILSNAQQSLVDLPLQIETLRRDLSATDSALLSAQASRDAAVGELEKLRMQFATFRNFSEIERRRFFDDNAFLRSKVATMPDLIRSSTGTIGSPKSVSNSNGFASIFKSTGRSRSTLAPTVIQFPMPQQAQEQSQQVQQSNSRGAHSNSAELDRFTSGSSRSEPSLERYSDISTATCELNSLIFPVHAVRPAAQST